MLALCLPAPHLASKRLPSFCVACRQLQLEQQYAEEAVPVPKPPHWGGFVVKPLVVEFWQGRPSRLHDRLRYSRSDVSSNDWKVDRLYP